MKKKWGHLKSEYNFETIQSDLKLSFKKYNGIGFKKGNQGHVTE